MNRTVRRYATRGAISLVFALAALFGSGGYKQFDLNSLTDAGRGTSYQRSGGGEDGKARTTDCDRPKDVVDVGLSKSKYPNILAHAREAVAKGWPEVMVINREGSGARRERLLQDIPTKSGYDRDEFPMAAGRGKGPGLEKGSDPTGWKADVKYVESAENRSAGSVVGVKLRRYCDGTRYRYVGY